MEQIGKCKQLHALWASVAAERSLAILPRKEAIELGEDKGYNPATCRTQFQVVYKRWQSAPVPAPTALPEVDATPGDQVGTDSVLDAAVIPVENPLPEPKLTKAQKRALAMQVA
jgi:hypothetical protein